MKLVPNVSVLSFTLDCTHDFISFLMTRELGKDLVLHSFGMFQDSGIFYKKQVASKEDVEKAINILSSKYFINLKRKNSQHVVEGGNSINDEFVNFLEKYCNYVVVDSPVNLRMGRDVWIQNYEEHYLLEEFLELKLEKELELEKALENLN